MEKYDIPSFDLVIVDLYPFEDTVKNNANEDEIIEKIDIGGISLIRAAAKNYKDVMIIPCKELIPNCISASNAQARFYELALGDPSLWQGHL